MGDTFDSRKGIDFSALTWAKDHYFDRLRDMGIEVHTIVGNHTAYYKNTNDINAIDLLLREYDNVKVYSETTSIEVCGLNVLLVPWINQENKEMTLKMINKSRAPVCMGHLELQGFKVNDYVVMDHGMDMDPFKKFEKVFSGHFHTRSTQDNISYLGNPYEIYWNDCEDTRGFHIFDTQTLETTPVNNPHRLFYKIYYTDNDYQLFDASELENKIVKLIVRKKTNTKKFEKFIDKLYTSNIAELKIVENFEFNGWYDKELDGDYESEDTMSILNKYIEESEINLDKSIIQKMMSEVYQEACELV
jgi:DNA repair exonuclease SbcCD nuclease subunit